ncbi:MAG: DUF669 domain-containing protein [Synergistaceae bacterium]|nr:DUF669 domain-containing protein [Synergistaceae bacterium]
MINWNYDPNDIEEYDPITPGVYRVRIEEAEEELSKTGRQMIVMKLKLSGLNALVWHNMVFLEEYSRTTNRKLHEIFVSFGITEGDLNPEHWRGKVGAAEIEDEEKDGRKRSVVKKFIARDKQNALPAWNEKSGNSNAPAWESNINPNMLDTNSNIPF